MIGSDPAQSDDRPPYSNRGVYPLIAEGSPFQPILGVDAYCGTVFSNPDALYDDLTALLEGGGFEPRQLVGEKVPYYARNLLLLANTGHRLLQVRAGGSNPHPFVECKGDASPLVCGFLRASHDHRVARFDVARDMRGQGLFRRYHRLDVESRHELDVVHGENIRRVRHRKCQRRVHFGDGEN